MSGRRVRSAPALASARSGLRRVRSAPWSLWLTYPAMWGQWFVWRLFGLLLNGSGRLSRLVMLHGIVVFVGPNGSGKSLAAVDSLLPALDGIAWECFDVDHMHHSAFRKHAGNCSDCDTSNLPDVPRCAVGLALIERDGRGERVVYSTLPLLGDDGRPHPRYRALSDYRQLVQIEHAEVLFDEVAGVSDAGDSASMPASLKRWLQQLRKRDVRLRVTTPAYDRCSLPIRQVATLVVDARSFFVDRAFEGRVWRPRRAMVFEAFDGFAFRSFDKNSADSSRIKREALCYFWRPGCRAQRSYNTLAQVHALTEVSDAGMCGACGGTRSKPKCACPPGLDDLAVGELTVIETTGPGGGRVRRAQPVTAVNGG